VEGLHPPAGDGGLGTGSGAEVGAGAAEVVVVLPDRVGAVEAGRRRVWSIPVGGLAGVQVQKMEMPLRRVGGGGDARDQPAGSGPGPGQAGLVGGAGETRRRFALACSTTSSSACPRHGERRTADPILG